MKTVHKSPQLDLVGWYTVLPRSGPTASTLSVHRWMLAEQNESSLLLAFHPEEAVSHSVGSKLPLTIYESIHEADEPKIDQGEDREMRDGEPPLRLRFRELPYSVETGEAEMISMDFVARGAGNATAVESRAQKKPAMVAVDTDPKGKRRIVSPESRKRDDMAQQAQAQAEASEHMLSREDEELIASLHAKANAVKMLQSRIGLLITYLERLPPSYLSSGAVPSAEEPAGDSHSVPSNTILRSIQALVSRLALVVPSATEAFEQEMLSESNDVRLMALLDEVTQSAGETRDLGRMHHVVESAKSHNKKAHEPSSLDIGGFPRSAAGDLTV